MVARPVPDDATLVLPPESTAFGSLSGSPLIEGPGALPPPVSACGVGTPRRMLLVRLARSQDARRGFRGSPPRTAPLTHSLEQDDRGRRGHVQTADVARHGNGGHEIAPLAHQPPKTGAFAPRTSAVGSVRSNSSYGVSTVGVQSHRPDTRVFQFVERPGDVDDVGDRHVMHGARRRPLQPRRPAARRAASAARLPSRRPHPPYRRIAPTLCGSSTPSSTTMSGAPRSPRASSSSVASGSPSTSATMP